ncbi:MAG: PH domain-containing protein [Phycisphaeraceae bacterium]|nr:PH domain-containing protein [Phycisphaeraceae bacterium]MCW5753489.1 PH domain-containing protein [Phycisphaeraceae bacterium]
MIRFTCDRCDRPLEVDDDLAGRKVECPHCGDVNIVPARKPEARTPSPPTDRAAAAGYPPDSGPEQRVMFVRPAMMRAKPTSFLLLSLGVIAGVTGMITSGSSSRVPEWVFWPGALITLASVIVLAWWKILTLGAALEITNKRTIERRGLFSKSTSEVLHDAIRNIQIDQSFWNRIWRIGSIGISSSGQDGIEIHIADLPNPDKIRSVIDLYRPL